MPSGHSMVRNNGASLAVTAERSCIVWDMISITSVPYAHILAPTHPPVHLSTHNTEQLHTHTRTPSDTHAYTHACHYTGEVIMLDLSRSPGEEAICASGMHDLRHTEAVATVPAEPLPLCMRLCTHTHSHPHHYCHDQPPALATTATRSRKQQQRSFRHHPFSFYEFCFLHTYQLDLI